MSTHNMLLKRNASCMCGNLTLRVAGEPQRVYICNCLACQRRTGNVFGVLARFAKDQVEINGASKEFVRIGDSGNTVTLNFCLDCGSSVFATLQKSPDAVIVPVGAFADPDFPVPTFSIYERHRHTWFDFPEDMAHHD